MPKPRRWTLWASGTYAPYLPPDVHKAVVVEAFALDDAMARIAELERDLDEARKELTDRIASILHNPDVDGTSLAAGLIREGRERERSECVARIAAQEEAKNAAYWERNMLAVALATIYMGRLLPHVGEPFDEPGWDSVLIFELPRGGQVSFHVHASQIPEVLACPTIRIDGAQWDGHTNDEKWERVRKFSRRPLPVPWEGDPR